MAKSQDNPALGLIRKMERALKAAQRLNVVAQARLDSVEGRASVIETRLDEIDSPGGRP